MDSKKDILWRVYVMYAFICLFALAIVAQIFKVQFKEGDMWRKKAQDLTTRYNTIEAVRGNIFAEDGSLLATSLPIYEVRMDVNADAISDKMFYSEVDSLAFSLAELFPEKSQKEFKDELKHARRNGERYHLIRRNVRFTELKKMRTFNLFRLGKYKGGLICLQQNKREMPFKNLAFRTIGYDREGLKPVGLEGAYNNYLTGTNGKRLMQKIAGNVWMPVDDDNEIEPQDGSDIITTIDVNIQDVAQASLLNQLKKHKADHGCVVLMEVETGAIKAIANYTKIDTANYVEDYNYAIAEATEPGSTFKLASLMAAMEDGYINLNDSVSTEGGTKMYHGQTVHDHEDVGTVTVQRAFETSSNVAVTKFITQNYAKDPQKFIDRLYSMNLNKPLGLDISGEGTPRIKSTKDKDWSAVSLPWISYGYELKITPLQLLTFYNAVANDGKMVKPQFVKEIVKRGKVVKAFTPYIINESICSKETIKKAKIMMEGVVERGTARRVLKNTEYKTAGKTGTAQISKGKAGYGNKENSSFKKTYQASFIGYFPAENPKYSCIVVVNNPQNKMYYSADVACPIFKEIADKVYSTSLEIHKDLQKDTANHAPFMPLAKGGLKQDLSTVFQSLKISSTDAASKWVTSNASEKNIQLCGVKISNTATPNVVGMGLQDALYLLENRGFRVVAKGKGSVAKQSINPGTLIIRDTEIIIELT